MIPMGRYQAKTVSAELQSGREAHMSDVHSLGEERKSLF